MTEPGSETATAGGGAERLPYFFVLGAPKSGTTWLQKLIDAHPQLVCRGEGKFRIFRKELAKAATSYNEYLDRNQQRVFGEEFFPTLSRWEFDALFRRFMELRLCGEEIPSGVVRVGNKDPEHGTALLEIADHFPDAAYIHIIRDPRDVVVSNWFHMNRVAPKLTAQRGGFEDFVRQSLIEWRTYVSHVRKSAPEKRLQYMELYYEALRRDPEAELARVFEFLGVPAHADIISQCVAEASFERATGGRPRGFEDPKSFYRKGEAGDWRNHMNEELAGELLAATEGLAEELGYR